MNVGTRITLASFALMLLARTAGAEAGGALPWQESFTARLEALALLQTLNAELLSHDSATLTLDRWCAAHRLASPAHIVAERVNGVYQAPTDQPRQLLDVSATEPIRYRRVRLICGDHVLSEADTAAPARPSCVKRLQTGARAGIPGVFWHSSFPYHFFSQSSSRGRM